MASSSDNRDEEITRQIGEISGLSVDEIKHRQRLVEAEVRILQSEKNRLAHEQHTLNLMIQENKEKIKLNTQLPFLVANVVEILDPEHDVGNRIAEDDGSDGSGMFNETLKNVHSAIVKTSSRQMVYLPVIGLVDPKELRPNDLVGVNKDSYLILEKLPAEYDPRVKAMELEELPSEDYSDIGGLEKQIQELIEAVVLPLTHAERFDAIGIKPPKGVLLYGPPGTGKTMMARACAAQCKASFLKLAGPQLVQMFIGDGAKMIRDAFDLAREKAPTIIFIDEIDAIGTRRSDTDHTSDREVHRTMLELLNQLDGFKKDDRVKVVAATNRVDTLDPALLRSGRLDRKIELPLPDEVARARILRIHSRKMNVASETNFDELARSTEDFNGAMLKAVCVEAGMIALRRDATEITHEDFVDGIAEVETKKKSTLNYYS